MALEIKENKSLGQGELRIFLAGPRGFCAGVDRAIQIVEKALKKFGAPVYVRHEIVHNRYVVESLEKQGAVFVDELDEAPHDRPIIFSAHGVPKIVPERAEARQMIYLDATCPLVTKVHREAERQFEAGNQIILIGHAGHPEVIGTMGQLPMGAVLLIESEADIEKLSVRDPQKLAYVTQTTLSVDDTAHIVAALRARFPEIAAPRKDDICYATTNRQEAVKNLAPLCDAMIVIGAPNSSNSMRLVEVAKKAGCAKTILLQRAAELDWDWLSGVQKLGITAGASAPEILVEELIAHCKKKFSVEVEEVAVRQESVQFKLPKLLTDAA